MGSARSNIFKNCLAVGVGITCAVLLIVIVEYTLRFISPQCAIVEGNDDVVELHRYSELYGWQGRGNASGILAGQRLSLNKNGFRGKQYAYDRTPGKKRVVMVGDSNGFGYGVPDGKCMGDLFNLINTNTELVNLSVQGYGTDQELLLLVNEGFHYRPDLVILCFSLENDFIDNNSQRFIHDNIHPKPYFTLDGGALHLHGDHLELDVVQSLLMKLNDSSCLFNKCVEIFSLGQRRQSFFGPPPESREDVSPAITISLISEMGKAAALHNAQFAIVLFPSYYMVPGNPLSSILLSSEELNDYTILDLTNRLSKYEPSRIYLNDGLHLNEVGHRIAFEEVDLRVKELLRR